MTRVFHNNITKLLEDLKIYLKINKQKRFSMSGYDQEEPRDKTAELNTALPFMVEFPFKEYDIQLVERGEDFLQLGISPMLINEFGDTGTIESLNFYYTERGSDVSISINKYDVEWIAEQADLVKKLDAIRKSLDDGLESKSLIDKIKSIKFGKKFTKLIGCDNTLIIDFNELLSEFIKLYDATFTSKIKLGLQKLSEATLNSTELSERQYKAASAFFNFQIHYIKILLGIVIAAKIY